MATLIKIDGSQYEVEPQNKENGFTLQEIYNLLGCKMVEIACDVKNRMMIVDEEGKLSTDWRQNVNRKATDLYCKALGFDGDVIVGNVLLCTDEEFQ